MWYRTPEFIFAHVVNVPKNAAILITAHLASLDLTLICMLNELDWVTSKLFFNSIPS